MLVPLGAGAPALLKPFGLAEAQAQEQRRTLLGILFGNRRQAEPAKKAAPRSTSPRRATTRSSPTRRSTQTRQAAAPAPEVVEKVENARTVLVVGDFISDGMADGLQEAFADVASVVIQTRANGSSGLVRDDYYNWPAEIGGIIEAVGPDILVVQLGSNDRQAMRVDGSTEKVRTEAWTKEYERRIDTLLDAIAEAGAPVVWVGAPPFKFSSMSADILAFNELYRNATEARGGYFVDIWDGFVDEEGRFVSSGTDINGQNARLRAADGINFTRAGKRKMAFYVERQLKLLLGDDAAPLLTSLAPDGLPMLKLPPLQTESDLVRTNPIALLDPDLDGGSVLLGDVEQGEIATTSSNPLQAKSVRQRLVEDGTPPPSQPGRAGNFRWQSPETTSATQVLELPSAPPEF